MPGMKAEELVGIGMEMELMDSRDATEKVCIDVRAILEQLGLDSQKWHEVASQAAVEE